MHWTLLLLCGLSTCCAFLRIQRFKQPSYSPKYSTVAPSQPVPAVDSKIVNVELNDELKTSFLSYAVSTILGRALPDARDGLKPVHRRVLYAMQVLGLTPDSGYRKCARIVGEVLGKYHPHGDQSVYDALVRMAQDFVMQHPLVSGHGNFGSVDGDPPAAMRYTEARLSSLAYDSLLTDIKEDSVGFISNFDGNEEEPLVLPARLPMLLLNGASGIAVGMATNIPPHNLGELADAVVALIDKPELTNEELLHIVSAPDFPTGGQILGLDGAAALYTTGHGSITMRAQSHIEILTPSGNKQSQLSQTGRARTAIVVTELPYMTNKATLLEKIAELVNDKKLDGISDLRDETDREGMRIVIELKKDAIPAVVQNNLYKKTSLQTTFSGNMLALMNNGTLPQRITLKDALSTFIDFRFHTVRRRTAHRLSKLRTREHLVQGLLSALTRIDPIIHLIKTSADSAQARSVLTSSEYNFSTEQAEAILSLTLRRLTALEATKLQSEHSDLTHAIAGLDILMQNNTQVYDVIKSETLELRQKHAISRRSEIVTTVKATLNDIDLIANERSVIIITKSGYIKRMSIAEFEAQQRGGRGKAGARLSTEKDAVAHFFACNDHDTLIFTTDRGVAYSKPAYQVPLAARTARGVPLPQVLPIGTAESVTSVIPVASFTSTTTEEVHLVLLTDRGFMKKTPLKAFEAISNRGLQIISLESGDALKWARLCTESDEVLVATRDGYASRFPVSQLTSTGRGSRGSRALDLREGDRVADLDVFQLLQQQQQKQDSASVHTDHNSSNSSVSATCNSTNNLGSPTSPYVLVVTEQGYGKCVSIDAFHARSRGSRGSTLIKFRTRPSSRGTPSLHHQQQRGALTEGTDAAVESTKKTEVIVSESSNTDHVSNIRLCQPCDEVVISTSRGTVTRQRVADISVQSRHATGVRLQSIDSPHERIISVDVEPGTSKRADKK